MLSSYMIRTEYGRSITVEELRELLKSIRRYIVGVTYVRLGNNRNGVMIYLRDFNTIGYLRIEVQDSYNAYVYTLKTLDQTRVLDYFDTERIYDVEVFCINKDKPEDLECIEKYKYTRLYVAAAIATTIDPNNQIYISPLLNIIGKHLWYDRTLLRPM